MNCLGVKNKIALTNNGEVITDYEFDYSKESKNAIALWNDNTIVWYDKKTGKLIKKIKGLSNVLLKHGLFILTYDKYKGVNALDGKTIILSDKFTDIIPNEYCIKVISEGKCGAYTYEGKCIMPVRYADIIFLETGMVIKDVGSVDYYGLYPYDGTGDIISCEYRYEFASNNDVIIYENETNGYHQIFSHDGKKLGVFRTDRGNFKLFDNAIKIERNHKKGLVSYTGGEIVAPEYDYITETGEGDNKRFILDRGDKSGIATIEKGITIPVEFDENLVTYYEYVIVRKGEKYALYTYEGEELIPLDDNKIINSSSFYIPGVFEIIDKFNSDYKMIYIAPLNKYVSSCRIKYDKENGNYYRFDNVYCDWVKI